MSGRLSSRNMGDKSEGFQENTSLQNHKTPRLIDILRPDALEEK
jgi:hypothetical protein